MNNQCVELVEPAFKDTITMQTHETVKCSCMVAVTAIKIDLILWLNAREHVNQIESEFGTIGIVGTVFLFNMDIDLYV